ncbi:MAG: twin-arginine translocation signal domain-containing protein, partial [Bacteroidota bacterium]|nr:twin-arginine translocation signal domain-containing protein [Bacteroidota bacterium]
MATNRRTFLTTAALGGLAAALPFPTKALTTSDNPVDYARLDQVLSKPVFKKELFKTPVIIDKVELLRYKDTFLCRVRSKDGAEGISVANSGQMKSLYAVFVNRVQPFFIGKDARDLEA